MPDSHWDWVSCGPKWFQVVLGLGPSWNMTVSTQIRDPRPGTDSKSSKKPVFLEMFLGPPKCFDTSKSIQKLLQIATGMRKCGTHGDGFLGFKMIQLDFMWRWMYDMGLFLMFSSSFCWHSLAAWLEHRRSVISSGCQPIFLTWFVAI